jgi:membrane-associated phospholipid phosphatase
LRGVIAARLLARADRAVFRALRTSGHTPAAERAVAAFSQTGQYAALWLALGSAGAALDRPRRGRWLHGVGVVAGAYVLNTAIKFLVRRPRPVVAGLPALIATPTQLSFPSAHATSSFAGARVYAPLAGRAGPGLLYPLAVGLAASRVYLGVHHPSDILAGALLGTVVGGRFR